jgi:hypothetical protein
MAQLFEINSLRVPGLVGEKFSTADGELGVFVRWDAEYRSAVVVIEEKMGQGQGNEDQPPLRRIALCPERTRKLINLLTVAYPLARKLDINGPPGKPNLRVEALIADGNPDTNTVKIALGDHSIEVPTRFVDALIHKLQPLVERDGCGSMDDQIPF